MSSSRPPRFDALDDGWAASDEDRAPDSDDNRTLEKHSRPAEEDPSPEDGFSDDRATAPPPVPAAEYVQTMMQQASDEPDPYAQPGPPPFSWPAPSAKPPSSGSRAWRDRGEPLAAVPRPAPAAADEPDLGDFTLTAHEPERLAGARGDFPDPRFELELELTPAPGFDDLPFDDLLAVSDRERADAHLPTPAAVAPSTRRPLPFLSSASPSAPALGAQRSAPPPGVIGPAWTTVPAPALDPAWSTVPAPSLAVEPERAVAAPTTQRGLAGPSAPWLRGKTTQTFVSPGDAIVTGKPASSRREPIVPSPRPPQPVDPFIDVRELFDAGDFSSALVMAEALLETDPEHAEALSCAASCRETLLEKYLSRLGGRRRILRVALPPDEVRWLSLDHKAGFVLSCIDGVSSIEEVLDVACMQEFEAIRILHDFRELGVVEVLPDQRSPRR